MTTTDDNGGAQTSQHATNSLAFTHPSQTRSGRKYEARMPCSESVKIKVINNNLTVITATNVYKRHHMFDYLTRNKLAEFVGEGLSPHALKDLYYAKSISHDLSSVSRSFDLPNLRELTLAISLDTIRCSNNERVAVIREISDDSLNQLLARAPAINELDISFNMSSGFDFGYAAPCSGILSNFKPQSLELISLEGFTDTDNFLSSFIRRYCRTLTVVCLGNISVGHQPLTTIFEAIEEACVKKAILSGTLKGSNGREVLKLNDVGKDVEDLQKALELGQRATWISLLNQHIKII